MNQGVVAIQFRPDAEYALDRESLQSRQYPGWSYRCFRQHHGDPITQLQAQAGGHLPANNDAKLSGLQIVQPAFDHMVFNDGNAPLLLWQYTIEHDAANVTATRDHALPLNKGRCSDHRWVLLYFPVHFLPVIKIRVTLDHSVRHHAQNPLLELTVEAIHHRQHDDEDSHAQHQANHGGQGNERNEVITSFGRGVPQADIQ